MKYLTVVYHLPETFEASELTNHRHASAMAWSHKMDECRALESRLEGIEVELRKALATRSGGAHA